jgi:hypothetical protein
MNKMEAEQQVSEQVIEKIRKLLALSQSDNENEASLAMSRAEELLERYNLSISSIKIGDKHEPDLIQCFVEADKPYIRHLYNVVALHNFCRVVGEPSVGKAVVLGRYVNVVMTLEMGLWLIEQVNRMVTTEMGNFNGNSKFVKDENGNLTYRKYGNGESKSTYRLSYIAGLISTIDKKLDELSRQRHIVNPSLTALTINLSSEVEMFMNKKFPSLTRSSSSIGSSSGYRAGQQAGNGLSFISPSRHIESSSTLRLGGGR